MNFHVQSQPNCLLKNKFINLSLTKSASAGKGMHWNSVLSITVPLLRFT